MAARQELEIAYLTLENDRKFYDDYTRPYDEMTSDRQYRQREVIRFHLSRLQEFIPGDFSKGDRESLRRYFNDRYGITTPLLPPAAQVEPTYDLLAPEEPQEAQKPTAKAAINYRTENVFYSLQGHPAMSQNLNLTTKHYLNGQDIETLSDATLFVLIQMQEAEVKNLLSITHKPKSLLAEIEKRQAGISALVAFMDEREAKRNPQPAKPAKPTGPDLQTLQGSV